jgi:tetratricopeptide (TPR) repeat protein
MLVMVRENLAKVMQRQARSGDAEVQARIPLAEGADLVLEEARREHQAGNADKAVPLYRQYLLADPKNAQAWYLLGAALRQLGQLSKEPHSALDRLKPEARWPREAFKLMHVGQPARDGKPS